MASPTIVGSLTTIPKRISKIEPTLLSLLSQERKLDKVYLTLGKDKFENTALPTFLSKYKNVEIVWVDDVGPMTKILGGILRETNPETKIITFDDDIIYPKDSVLKLEQASNKNPKSAIGFAGFRIGKFPFYLSNVSNYDGAPKTQFYNFLPKPEGSKSDILAGYSAILYKRGFFPSNEKLYLLTNLTKDKNLRRNDDVALSAWLSSQNIDRLIIPGTEILRRQESYENNLSGNGWEFFKTITGAIRESEKRGLLKNRESFCWYQTATGVPVLIILFLIFALILLFLKFIYFRK